MSFIVSSLPIILTSGTFSGQISLLSSTVWVLRDGISNEIRSPETLTVKLDWTVPFGHVLQESFCSFFAFLVTMSIFVKLSKNVLNFKNRTQSRILKKTRFKTSFICLNFLEHAERLSVYFKDCHKCLCTLKRWFLENNLP